MGFGKDGKGVIIRDSTSQALGALASGAGIIIGTKLALTSDFRMIKLEAIGTFSSLTNPEGRGLALYIVDGQFSVAEIEVAIEGNGPLGPNQSDAAEIAMRFEKWLGEVLSPATGEGVAIAVGKQTVALMEETIRWTFSAAQSWNFFVYNHGATLTTGSNFIVRSKSFGVWVR